MESWLPPLREPQVDTCHGLARGPPPAVTQGALVSPALPAHGGPATHRRGASAGAEGRPGHTAC